MAAKKISDLAGKRVAAVGRYAYGEQVDNAVGVYFINSRNDQDSLDKLLAGEVDYMLVDELVARYLMTYQPDEASARIFISAGASVAVAPLVLGALADRIGLRPALWIVPALLVALVVLAGVGQRSAGRSATDIPIAR